MPLCACEEIQSSKLHGIARYLESKRREDGCIYRADIDPVIEIPRYVAMLVLIEQTFDSRRRVRLIGTRAAETLGRDVTGRWIDELEQAPAPDSPANALDVVFGTDAMIFGRTHLPWNVAAATQVEWLAQRFGTPPDRTGLNGMASLAILALDHDGMADSQQD